MKRPPVIDYSAAKRRIETWFLQANRAISICFLALSLLFSVSGVLSVWTQYRLLHIFPAGFAAGFSSPFFPGEFTSWHRQPWIHWQFAGFEFSRLYSFCLRPWYIMVPHWAVAAFFLVLWRAYEWFLRGQQKKASGTVERNIRAKS